MTIRSRLRLWLEVIISFIAVMASIMIWQNVRILHIALLLFGIVIPFILLPEKVHFADIPRQLGFQRHNIPVQIFYGILSALACYASYLVLTAVCYWTVLRGNYTIEIISLLPSYSQATPTQIMMLILLILEIVFCEEIYFRGYLMNRFGQLISNQYLSVFIIAMIFGLAHMPGQISDLDSITDLYAVFVWRFIVSFIPGLFWVKLKNYTLLSTMTAHLITNFCAYFLFQGAIIPV